MFFNDDLNSFIWLIFVGICFASFYAYYTKTFLGGLVRKLVSSKINDEASAKTLTELGYNRFTSSLIKSGLNPGTAIRRYVNTVFPDNKSYFDDLLFSNEKKTEQRYYIPSENCDIALRRYDQKGTSLLAVIITVVAFFVVALLATVIIPIFTGTSTDGVSNNAPSVNQSFSGEIDKAKEEIPSSTVSNTPQSGEASDTDEEFSMLSPSTYDDNAN